MAAATPSMPPLFLSMFWKVDICKFGRMPDPCLTMDFVLGSLVIRLALYGFRLHNVTDGKGAFSNLS